MARKYAIAIGINHYQHLAADQQLHCAENDAVQMRSLLESLKFEVFQFSDQSPPVRNESTQPTRTVLRRAVRRISERVKLKPEDSFWFFFSGHGARYGGADFLLPCDGDREDIQETAIAVTDVIQRLSECGAGNLVLILDACRNRITNASKDIWQQTIELAKEKGVVTMFSCRPGEKSYELRELNQGAFTYALLEGLKGNCPPDRTTIKQLNDFLTRRVPELHQASRDRQQMPYLVLEPLSISDRLLLPSPGSKTVEVPVVNPLANVQQLEAEAILALANQDWERAIGLWQQIAETSDQPGQIRLAYRTIETLRTRQAQSVTPPELPPEPPPPQPEPDPKLQQQVAELRKELQRYAQHQSEAKSPKVELEPTPKPSLPTFNFDIITVNATGEPTHRRQGQAEYFRQDLGNGITLDLVSIPGGSFQMGASEGEAEASADEYPQHLVTIKPFFMGKYAVTQAQWKAVAALPKVKIDLKADPANFKGAQLPVERVSWEEAVEFCARLSHKTQKTYRLPSEAEWEYACRAGTTTPFYFGETITPELVNYNGNYPYGKAAKGQYRQKTVEVGSLPPNAVGLYEMHGNVWEWCADAWHNSYNKAPTDGSVWEAESGSARLLRGGSWGNNSRLCRSANRSGNNPAWRYYNLGFRVVCSAS